MPMKNHVIFGVHVTHRTVHVAQVQERLTEYGCNIRTRLGLHEASDDFCSPNGLIILEMVGDETTCDQLMDKLNAIEGVECKKMFFDHP